MKDGVSEWTWRNRLIDSLEKYICECLTQDYPVVTTQGGQLSWFSWNEGLSVIQLEKSHAKEDEFVTPWTPNFAAKWGPLPQPLQGEDHCYPNHLPCTPGSLESSLPSPRQPFWNSCSCIHLLFPCPASFLSTITSFFWVDSWPLSSPLPSPLVCFMSFGSFFSRSVTVLVEFFKSIKSVAFAEKRETDRESDTDSVERPVQWGLRLNCLSWS